MDRYFIFKSLLEFVADNYDVTNAKMKNYSDNIEITGVDGNGNTVTISARIEEGEKIGN